MKKLLSVILLLLTVASLTACKAAPSSASEESSQSITESETCRMAYGKMLWDIYQNGTLPDGSSLNCIGEEEAAKNSFAIIDIDNDGQEELLLYWTTAATCGVCGYIFAYDDGTVHSELVEVPYMTFYDNGVIEADWSHNQGLAGAFWPYNVYRYDIKSDTYEPLGSVDAWDKRASGETFPVETDIDGDGLVYYLLPADWNGSYYGYYGNDDVPLVDGSDYESWRNDYLNGAEEIDIPFQKLTEENISSLGYPKPDVKRPQPAG